MKISTKLVFICILALLFVGSITLFVYTSNTNSPPPSKDSLSPTPKQNKAPIPVSASDDPIPLDAFCKNSDGKYDGYYHAKEEPQCSRAPWCGPIYDKLLRGEEPGTSSDTNGYDYDTLNTLDYMPNPGTCSNLGGPQGTFVTSGLYPLCCYEIERTGDPQKCHGYWERKYCHPSQCRKIIKSTDECGSLSPSACQIVINHGIEIGEDDFACGDGLTGWGYTEDTIVSPVPLSVRVATPTPTPDSSTPTATSSPENTNTPTLTRTPTPTTSITATATISPTLTLTSTPTLTPTLTPTYKPSNTPAPTFPLAPLCDKSCGICGWRDTSNLCHENGPVPTLGVSCCYSTCINGSCNLVYGVGKNLCASGQTCVAGGTSSLPTVQLTSTNLTVTPANLTITPTNLTVTPTNPATAPTVANIKPTQAVSTPAIAQKPITTSPPVSGVSSWAILLAIPILILGAGLIL